MKNTITQGNCLDVLKTMPDNHIDTIITDPPYGLSFMGKKWDYDVPSIDIWKECLRVLKPGGTALIFAGSRTQHRMACNVEDAGFILKDTIMWLYGSGFPKATDISKQLDKGNKREKIDTGKTIPNIKSGNYENSSGKERLIDFVEIPATPEAKLWNGWKSHGLKPAYEPILVCMKPNDGTYAENALKYGVSGLNIEQSRIPTEENLNGGIYSGEGKCKTVADHEWGFQKRDGEYKQPTGRFPANIILDEEAGKMLDEQSGVSKDGIAVNKNRGDRKKSLINYANHDGKDVGFGGKGGASRFFYCAKASKSERNKGCEGLEEKRGGSMEANISDKMQLGGASLKGEHKEIQSTKNTHPTVKPLKLMEYLCTLTKTPTGGIVLDPFCGSGTTLMAAKLTGRDYIGIEREEEYIEIAKCRVDAVKIEGDLFKEMI